MFSRMKKVEKKFFSLIELLIVIGIMGALAALILPAFSTTESAAKDTACDYNQAGTLRYLTMFRSANGVYPSGFHTGLQDAGAAIMDNLTPAAENNFGTNGSQIATLSADEVDSLKKAGIVQLAYGVKGAEDLSATMKVVAVDGTKNWTEEVDAVTGDIVPAGAALTVRGAKMTDIAALGASATATVEDVAGQFRKANEADFKVVPFFVAPTIDWETYYDGGPNESKISIAMAGKCPWGDDGQARYYITFFKVYADGTPARLLATSCPDCGVLDSDAF